jgi:hypothetical protein
MLANTQEPIDVQMPAHPSMDGMMISRIVVPGCAERAGSKPFPAPEEVKPQ